MQEDKIEVINLSDREIVMSTTIYTEKQLWYDDLTRPLQLRNRWAHKDFTNTFDSAASYEPKQEETLKSSTFVQIHSPEALAWNHDLYAKYQFDSSYAPQENEELPMQLKLKLREE